MNKTIIQNNIEKLRSAQSLTMKELAEKAGTSQQQIDRLEKGKRKISAEWMQRLSTALNCRPTDLVNFSLSDKPEQRITATAEVTGAIETKFGNNVREFTADEKYDITFKPAKKDLAKKFFALVVEGGNYKNYPANSELVFLLNKSTKFGAGMREKDSSFTTKAGNKGFKFQIGNELVEAELVKSIRNE